MTAKFTARKSSSRRRIPTQTSTPERRAELRAILTELDRVVRRDEASSKQQTPNIRWLALAQRLGVSIYCVQNWSKFGWVPRPMAMLIETKFGRAKVKSETLYHPCPPIR